MKILSESILLTACLLGFAVTGATIAQEARPTTQLEPGGSVTVDITDRVGLLLHAGREKNEEQESGKWKIGAGINFRAKPLFKRFLDTIDTDKRHVLVVGAGYEYARSTERGETTKEHKIMLDATVRWAFKGKFLLSNRNRFEIRWVNGDAHFRVRERLKLERPLTLPVKYFRRRITPFGTGEAFWDQRYKKWNIFRYGGGFETPLLRRTTLDFIYERMRCVTCVDPDTNIFTMRLNLYLRRKKK